MPKSFDLTFPLTRSRNQLREEISTLFMKNQFILKMGAGVRDNLVSWKDFETKVLIQTSIHPGANHVYDSHS